MSIRLVSLITAILISLSWVPQKSYGKNSSSLNVLARDNFLSDIEFNSKLVNKWFAHFTNGGRQRFLRHLNRGEKYRTLVESIFLSHGLPIELYYVGLIESGYVLKAKSHMSAVGPWQFIASTGKNYGLRIDQEIDERLNIYKSTHAAAKYLSDLYNIFNSWALSIAAYNAGEYRIMNAIRKGNTRSFNELIKKKLLPKETENYVSKFWTAMMIDHYARDFGFYKKENIKPLDDLNLKIGLKKKYSLKKLVRYSGMKKQEFLTYNQHLKTSSIRGSYAKPVDIYLPEGRYLNFVKRINGKKLSNKSSKIVKVKNPDYLRIRGFKNLHSGEKLQMTELGQGRVKIKRLKNGQTLVLKTPRI